MTSGTAVCTSAAAAAHSMAWTNERLKLSCADGIGFKSLWRMLVLDKSNGAAASNISRANSDTYLNSSAAQIAELLENRVSSGADRDRRLTKAAISKDNMSLLKCLAINALELSAPASPLLLQQQTHLEAVLSASSVSTAASPGCGWLQLAGHPESIAPAANGTVRKRISGPADSEAIAYRGLCIDPHAVHLIPHFHGCHMSTDPTTDPSASPAQHYLELQNLLHGFHNPAVMDIKMGRRTFLESEVTNDTLRPDLYHKMASVDPLAPTDAEHRAGAITKLRYMLFREQISSSQHHGFRVEALKQRHGPPVTDLRTMKCGAEVAETVERFVAEQPDVTEQLVRRLRAMRTLIERSAFFAQHEVVGSSVFIVYDAERVGVWLIDFNKCRRLPEGVRVDHRRAWVRGNHEEGLLHGFDELIGVFEGVLRRQMAEEQVEQQRPKRQCVNDVDLEVVDCAECK